MRRSFLIVLSVVVAAWSLVSDSRAQAPQPKPTIPVLSEVQQLTLQNAFLTATELSTRQESLQAKAQAYATAAESLKPEVEAALGTFRQSVAKLTLEKDGKTWMIQGPGADRTFVYVEAPPALATPPKDDHDHR